MSVVNIDQRHPAVLPHVRHLPLRVRLWIDFLKHSYATPGYWTAG